MKYKFLSMAGLALLLAGASWPQARVNRLEADKAGPVSRSAPRDFSVMTYNVKGLPWPVANGRPAALARIGHHLAALRLNGAQPRIVLLQEAFTDDAKAIGTIAGYRYIATGPSPQSDSLPAMSVGRIAGAQQPSLLKGETIGHWADSGLAVLSDFPIEANIRRIFPAGACAGYDCLASKGLQLAWIQIPGQSEPLAVLNTHLNSRRASGVSPARANRAFALEFSAVRSFVERHVPPEAGLIVAGDFNIGRDPERSRFVRRVGGPVPNAIDALQRALADGRIVLGSQVDARAIQANGKDKQFYRPGSDLAFKVRRIGVPFGSQAGVAGLSDHMGFATTYRLR